MPHKWCKKKMRSMLLLNVWKVQTIVFNCKKEKKWEPKLLNCKSGGVWNLNMVIGDGVTKRMVTDEKWNWAQTT